jgi:Spy/CpxP family protein refolding chaperone
MVKKMTIGVIVGVLILVSAAAGAIVYARDKFSLPGLILDGMKARMIEELELTPDQVKSVEAIFEEIRGEIPEMHKLHQELHEEFFRQFAANDFNQDEVKATLEKKLFELRSITDILIARVAEFHDILTPEQREKLVQHIKVIQENHEGGFGPGSGHGHFPLSK